MNDKSGDGGRVSIKRAAEPFDEVSFAHRLAEAAAAVNYNLTNPGAFINRLRNVEYGTSAEIEFAAILSWLGQCALIHQLGQQTFSSDSKRKWGIPDLLVVFERDGVKVPALIEVKTTAELVLRLGVGYVDSLYEYASLTSKPLLIAWRPRPMNFWLLLDPKQATREGSKLVIRLEEAFKQNLMSWMAGDLWIVLIEGVGCYFDLERKRDTDGREELEVRNSEFRDAEDQVVEPSKALLSILTAASKVKQEVADDRIRHSFVAGGLISSQQVFRSEVGWSLKRDERIHWRNVGRCLGQFCPSDDIRAEAQGYIGRFFSHIFTAVPWAFPDFLPPAWRA